MRSSIEGAKLALLTSNGRRFDHRHAHIVIVIAVSGSVYRVTKTTSNSPPSNRNIVESDKLRREGGGSIYLGEESRTEYNYSTQSLLTNYRKHR